MTLLKIFNEQLAQLSIVSEKIVASILKENWSEQKTDQAIEIVEQIKSKNMVKVVDIINHDYISLSELSITFSPNECGIKDATTFNEGNIFQAHQYICDLLADINKISVPDIHFSIGGHNYEEETTCIFNISWEF